MLKETTHAQANHGIAGLGGGGGSKVAIAEADRLCTIKQMRLDKCHRTDINRRSKSFKIVIEWPFIRRIDAPQDLQVEQTSAAIMWFSQFGRINDACR